MNQLFKFLMVTLCWLALAGSAFAAPLTRDGQAAALIVVPAEADQFEKLAAQDLVDYVKRISGVELTTVAGEKDAALAQAKAAKQTAVLLGRHAQEELAADLQTRGNVRGSFALKVKGDRILIAGPGEGTYYGVMELLEQLGVRWFMPGDLGTVIPEIKSINIADQTTVQAPSFPSRWFQMPHKEWQLRVRCGGDVFAGGHGIVAPPFRKDPKTGEFGPAENAEYYALVNGVRTGRQHCVSNPKLIEYVANSIKERRAKGQGPVFACGPNDGGGFCQCDNCKALDSGDYDPFSGEPSVTDRYIWFYNQVLEKVLPEYPDVKLAFYIYHTYMRPPQKFKPHPHIQGALAPIALDRVHGFSNPIAPEKSYARWLFQEWGKIMPELFDRGYWSNLACPGFTFIIIDRLRDEIPACYELGVKGWRVETFPSYGTQFPSQYVAAKLMWDHTTDVDALLTDLYEKFFGPAAKPMGQYITLMDAALRDGDYSTGSSWDMPHFYPESIRQQARQHLEHGLKLAAGKGVYEDRVKMIMQTFELTEAFVEMMNARSRVDLPAAQAQLDRLDAVANELMNYEPVPMLSAGRHSTYVNYMRRFFRGATEDGYKRVSGGNKLVAAADDVWQFQIDPGRVGEDIGLWRADITGGNWQTIKAYSSTWSNQGLRYYKGLAWYRQTVNIPADWAGKRLFLWSGGVDEKAKVWVNGQVIGISPGAAFYPFEMDATQAIKPGQNVITICVANERVNELGTGGLMAPVFIYAPAAGDDAKLDNGRFDLKETFP